MSLSLLFLLTLFLFTNQLSLSSSSSSPDRFVKSIPASLGRCASQEYVELTGPLPSDRLTPSCSLLALQHEFGDTVGRPPVSVCYSPPVNCTPPWSHVVLELRASCKGEQYDRIAGIWLDGAEILRTSTAEPTESGVFWKLRKDVTRYTSLLKRSNLELTVTLENVVNEVFTGVYNVSLTLLYYQTDSVRVPRSSVADNLKLNEKLGFEYEKSVENPLIAYGEEAVDSANWPRKSPPDLIIPISNVREEGFWFRIESESGVRTRPLQIPPNTRKAVLEVYVSFHGNDEFWYSNPPDSYIRANNLTTSRGHGAYREVFVTIDGGFVGSVIPFPVIFTGGINPLFWEPVVSIGAFNVPSYDFDLTPFLGRLLDGKIHFFGLGVSDSIPFWLVDANLHLWLDHGSSAVQAQAFGSQTPTFSIHRNSRFQLLDGSFKIKARRKSRFSGWVKSSAGNFTTLVSQHFRFKSLITFDKNGTYKMAKQRVIAKTEVKVESPELDSLISRVVLRRNYPLRVITSTLPGSKRNGYLIITNVSHALREESCWGDLSSSLHNSQESQGWMEVKDHSVLSGSASTSQSFSSRDDEFGCYSRIVSATDGRLVRDNATFICALFF